MVSIDSALMGRWRPIQEKLVTNSFSEIIRSKIWVYCFVSSSIIENMVSKSILSTLVVGSGGGGGGGVTWFSTDIIVWLMAHVDLLWTPIEAVMLVHRKMCFYWQILNEIKFSHIWLVKILFWIPYTTLLMEYISTLVQSV